MKINLLHKKITKSLLLASAISVLSLSSAYAGNYSVPEDEYKIYTDVIDLNGGNISLGNSGSIIFEGSTLGTSSSRFFFAIAPQVERSSYQTFTMRNSAIYIDSMNFNHAGSYLEINLFQNSVLNISDNVDFHYGSRIGINSSALYASMLDYNLYEIRLQNNSIGVFGVSYVDNLSIVDSTWHASSNSYADIVSIINSTLRITEQSSVSMGYLYLSSSTIEIVLDSPYQSSFRASGIGLGGDNTLKYEFTDEFIETVMADYGDSFDFSVTYAFVSGYMDDAGTLGYDIATSSDGYTWIVTDLGSGMYRFNDFVVIPEPSTYAVIFGVVALGLAIYRRKK